MWQTFLLLLHEIEKWQKKIKELIETLFRLEKNRALFKLFETTCFLFKRSRYLWKSNKAFHDSVILLNKKNIAECQKAQRLELKFSVFSFFQNWFLIMTLIMIKVLGKDFEIWAKWQKVSIKLSSVSCWCR